MSGLGRRLRKALAGAAVLHEAHENGRLSTMLLLRHEQELAHGDKEALRAHIRAKEAEVDGLRALVHSTDEIAKDAASFAASRIAVLEEDLARSGRAKRAMEESARAFVAKAEKAALDCNEMHLQRDIKEAERDTVLLFLVQMADTIRDGDLLSLPVPTGARHVLQKILDIAGHATVAEVLPESVPAASTVRLLEAEPAAGGAPATTAVVYDGTAVLASSGVLDVPIPDHATIVCDLLAAEATSELYEEAARAMEAGTGPIDPKAGDGNPA